MEAHHGSQANTWSGTCRNGFGAAAGVQAAGGVPHLVGRSGDEAPKGGDTGQGEILLRTPGAQQDMQLGLAEVGIGGAQAGSLGSAPVATWTDGDGRARWSGRPGPRAARRPG